MGWGGMEWGGAGSGMGWGVGGRLVVDVAHGIAEVDGQER